MFFFFLRGAEEEQKAGNKIRDEEDVSGCRYVPSMFKFQFFQPQGSTSMALNSILINLRSHIQGTIHSENIAWTMGPAAVTHAL